MLRLKNQLSKRLNLSLSTNNFVLASDLFYFASNCQNTPQNDCFTGISARFPVPGQLSHKLVWEQPYC
jgi:hypothetical protein